MGYRLGIDLGTTFTAAAIGNGQPPTMLGLGNRALQIPSVLFLRDDGSFLVGEPAERRGLVEPGRLVREFKRRIGDHVPLLVAGTPYSPQALTARLLSWVVATSTERVGTAPDSLVVTYPANWGAYKRELLDQVITLADVGQAYTCPEPQAAAAQYAARAGLESGGRIVVYDLGGGTFDVCVLMKTDSGFTILGSPEGIEHLGGIDFDEAVFRHVLTSLKSQLAGLDPESPDVRATLSRLRRDCVDAKEALSSDVDTAIPVALPGGGTTVRLTRSELESLIGPSLQDTISATARALRTADTTPEQLTSIVLVGGSSRIPLVSHLLQQHFGTTTALDTHPKHDVALGAVQYQPDGGPAERPPPVGKPTTQAAGAGSERPTTPSRLSPQEQARRSGLPVPPPARPAASELAGPSAKPAVEELPVAPPVEDAVEDAREDAAPPPPPVAGSRPGPQPTAPPPVSGPPPDATLTGPPQSPRPPRRSPVEWFSDASTWQKIGTVVAVVGVIAAGAVVVRLASGSSPAASTSGGPETSPSTPTNGQSTAPHAPGLPGSDPLPETSVVVPMETKRGDSNLYAVDTSRPGSRPKPLAVGPADETLPALSPDRKTVIYIKTPYSTEEGGIPENAVSTMWAMPAVPAAGDEPVRLRYRLNGSPCVSRPAWSPDASLLAVLCGPEEKTAIGLVHLAEDGPAVVTPLMRIDAREHPDGIEDLTFSGDGTQVIFADHANSGNTTGLYAVDVKSGATTRLTDGLDKDGDSSPVNPDMLAFRRADSLGAADIFLLSLSGGRIPCPYETSQEGPYTLCRLTDVGRHVAQDPSWSQDGSQIAFKWNTEDADLKVVPVSPTIVQPESVLPETHGGAKAPAWSAR
jgi:Tol biopolymer transport system component/actin-like ATPase involved in cell morphogenesis